MAQEQALALGNPRAKSLAHQMAVYCVMAKGGEDKNGKPRPRSPYRDVYDEARELYATRESTDEDRWTDLRRKNAAERKVAKEILRDLWEVARES